MNFSQIWNERKGKRVMHDDWFCIGSAFVATGLPSWDSKSERKWIYKSDQLGGYVSSGTPALRDPRSAGPIRDTAGPATTQMKTIIQNLAHPPFAGLATTRFCHCFD